MAMSYPFEVMDLNAIAEFLAKPRHALVATNRQGLSPLLSPVWFVYTEGKLFFAVLVSTAKYRSLIRDPHVSVCVDGGHPDARAVTFYGKARIVGDTDDSEQEIQRCIARRYMSSDYEVLQYMEKTRAAGRMALFVVTPDKVIARNYN
jgi:PPOX class probable F420-dependent enzyme